MFEEWTLELNGAEVLLEYVNQRAAFLLFALNFSNKGTIFCSKTSKPLCNY
jgi:hypothetical protein